MSRGVVTKPADIRRASDTTSREKKSPRNNTIISILGMPMIFLARIASGAESGRGCWHSFLRASISLAPSLVDTVATGGGAAGESFHERQK